MAVRRFAGRHWWVAVLGTALVAISAPAYADDPAPPPSQPPASVTRIPTAKSLEQMQAEAAQMQADFAKATIAYTTALKKAQEAKTAADNADRTLAAARTTAATARSRLGQLTAQAYQLGIPTSLGAESMLWSVSALAENLQELADRQSAITIAGTNQAIAYRDTVDTEEAATKAANDAVATREAANKASAEAQKLADDVRKKSAAAAAKMQDWLSQMELATAVSGQLQDSRNAAALARWRAYLSELTAAGITAPKAAALKNPANLPRGLQPLRDGQGKVVRGAAQVSHAGRPIRVLSAEAIRAVNAAFGLLGKDYGVAATGPDRYGCLGAARAAWTPYTTLPNLVSKVYGQYQLVPAGSAQPGDLLLMGNRSVGLFHIGVAIGDGEMIASDESKGSVIVTSVPENLYAVVRPTLGRPAGQQTPPRSTDAAFAFRCGAVQETLSVGTGTWVWPLPDGTFTIGTPFGQPGPMWATGMHTGQDFPAAIGTPVRAVAAGTAYVEHPAWAGNLVRIDHGNGTETLYAHLSAITIANGRRVQAGQQIGNVGALGNATGGGTLGWGGYTNGMIPATKLCALPGGVHALRCDAAAAYTRMAGAFRQRFGRALCITDSYRSYPQQVALYADKPSLAALPGTSNHGWGLAVDLCGGIQRFGTAEFRWMQANAARFGWVHPRWAEPGGSRPEPWHWEFGNL
jgi:hypothetical protein